MCWTGLCQVKKKLFSLSDWWHFSVIIKFISLAILSTLVWWALNLVLESWIREVLPFCLFIVIVWPLKKIKNVSSFHPMLSFRINPETFVHSNIRNTLRIFSGLFFSAFFSLTSNYRSEAWQFWGTEVSVLGTPQESWGVSMCFFLSSHFQNLLHLSLSLFISSTIRKITHKISIMHCTWVCPS